MTPDYSVQFLKLAGKSFAWIAGIAAIVTAPIALWQANSMHGYALVLPVIVAGYACIYAAIPVFLFAGFVVTLRAFGKPR